MRPTRGILAPGRGDRVSAYVEVQWLLCSSASDQFAHVSEQQLAAQLWAGCVRAALTRERRCGLIEHEGSVAHLSAVA